MLMCAQNAEVCTELKHDSVTAVKKPRKSKRGFSHAVAHNMRRTRVRIKGNEPNFDISPSIKMSTFSYDSSFSPAAGLLLHNGNKPLPLGTVTLLPPGGDCPHLRRCIFSPQDFNRATCAVMRTNLDFELIVIFFFRRKILTCN